MPRFRVARVLVLAAPAVLAAACAGSRPKADPGVTQGRLQRSIDSPDRDKPSPFDGKVFQSKAVRTREYRTKAASVDRTFGGAEKSFNVEARQNDGFTGKKSRFQEMASPLGNQSARTFTSRFDDATARTQTFYDADRKARTKRSPSDGKVFATRDYPVTARAQEDPIRGSDLVIGETTGGAPGGTADSGRLVSRPADLRPDALSPIGTAAGKPLGVKEIRMILNKGSR